MPEHPTTQTGQDHPSPEAKMAFDRLHKWRTETARAKQLPPYVVATDVALREISERRPQTKQALAACRGMGPRKIEAFGDQILSALNGAAPRAIYRDHDDGMGGRCDGIDHDLRDLPMVVDLGGKSACCALCGAFFHGDKVLKHDPDQAWDLFSAPNYRVF